MGLMQKRKGARAEREWAALCQQAGFHDCRRMGQQMFQRGSEFADCVGLPYLHQEIKAVERLDLRAAMRQSEQDAIDEGRNALPIVAHKKNRQGWLVTMRACDFFKLYQGFLDSQPIF